LSIEDFLSVQNNVFALQKKIEGEHHYCLKTNAWANEQISRRTQYRSEEDANPVPHGRSSHATQSRKGAGSGGKF